MRINFDTFKPIPAQSLIPHSASPIKICIESPVYNSVTRQLSPHNYQEQLASMHSLINLPGDVSSFLQKEIEKEMYAVTEPNQDDTPHHLEKCASIQKKEITNMDKSWSQAQISQQTLKQDNTTKKNAKKSGINSLMRSTQAQRTKKSAAPAISTQMKHCIKQMSELTGKPMLYASKVGQQVSTARKVNKKSVYQTLYNLASQRRLRADMKKNFQNEKHLHHKPMTNSQYLHKKFSYSPICERVDNILESREIKRRSKMSIDETTGQQLFKPDTSNSKQSYKIFLHSLSKQKLKPSTKLQTCQSRKLETSLFVEASAKKPNTIDSKTIEYFTQIFYPDATSPMAHLYLTENPLRKDEFLILHPFLHQIEELESRKFEMETTVSSLKNSAVDKEKTQRAIPREQFKTRFSKFYQRLNLHDRQVLRKETVQRRQNQGMNRIQPVNKRQMKPQINLRSASLDNLANGHILNIYYI